MVKVDSQQKDTWYEFDRTEIGKPLLLVDNQGSVKKVVVADENMLLQNGRKFIYDNAEIKKFIQEGKLTYEQKIELLSLMKARTSYLKENRGGALGVPEWITNLVKPQAQYHFTKVKGAVSLEPTLDQTKPLLRQNVGRVINYLKSHGIRDEQRNEYLDQVEAEIYEFSGQKSATNKNFFKRIYLAVCKGLGLGHAKSDLKALDALKKALETAPTSEEVLNKRKESLRASASKMMKKINEHLPHTSNRLSAVRPVFVHPSQMEDFLSPLGLENSILVQKAIGDRAKLLYEQLFLYGLVETELNEIASKTEEE
jgi:hypothetical protein